MIKIAFYNDNFTLECVNKNVLFPWPKPQDLDDAEHVAKYAALTTFQLKKLGYSSNKLGKLVKKGVLYRYKVITAEVDSLPSIYTPGYTAQVIARLPVPRFPDLDKLRKILMMNQAIISISSKTEANIDVNIMRPVQIITINNPVAVLVATDESYVELPLRYDLNQAIVILTNKYLAKSGFPFRYILEEDLEFDNFDLQFYSYSEEKGLFPIEINFEKKNQVS